MGEMSPPTAADYAAHNASKALEKNKELEQRLAEVERKLEALFQDFISYKVNHS